MNKNGGNIRRFLIVRSMYYTHLPLFTPDM